MASKNNKKKLRSPGQVLPAGVKRWSEHLDSKLAKMIRADGGVASGGRNLVNRKMKEGALGGSKKKGYTKSPVLPPGIKPSTRPITPQLRKMILEDRGIASGGRNIVHRKTGPAAR
jgi:hypothetical protein